MKILRALLLSFLALMGLALAGCNALVQSTASAAPLDLRQPWVLLPLVNNTETAQAALSAEGLLEHLLRARGVTDLRVYPASLTQDSLFDPTERKVADEAQAWAKSQGAKYGLTGSVQEWRYKSGIDGEPVVGITLKVLDLSSGKVVWSATGSQTGWSRNALSGVAQSLFAQLLSGMPATH
jgi:TolB-like protein